MGDISYALLDRAASEADRDGGWRILSLDEGYDGACPCSEFTVDGTSIELHCWRVCASCAGCGIHYRGDRVVAELIKPHLDRMNWYGEWDIVEGLRHG